MYIREDINILTNKKIEQKKATKIINIFSSLLINVKIILNLVPLPMISSSQFLHWSYRWCLILD